MVDKVDFTKGVKIIISPTEKGFACGIINEKLDLSSEGMYLCHIIAHGMLRFSIDHPQDAFDLGIEQLQSKPHKDNGKDPRFLDYDNVIDLAEIMFKRKKDFN
tara:strand:- start:349 stop:657 length:309 start_codon:yes stop_codon:yes gene_type:complete